VFGYGRVSTDGQTLEAPLAQLEAAGMGKIFREKVSGVARGRPRLALLLAFLLPGDVVLVTRLDRLARSTRDLLNVLAAVTKKGAAFRSLGDPWADTTMAHGRLMLAVLAGLAEFERELIRVRTGEGRAKAAGQKMGRLHKLTSHQRQEARARRAKVS
jgi:DNA invertase Pin-like site-specific DNA recombinase